MQLALAMMADGRARSKSEAARLAGVDESSLKPAALKAFALRNPIGQVLSRDLPHLLTITAEVAGKRVSMREVLAGGVENAVGILGKLAPRIGKWSKVERQRAKDAQFWITLCRSSGLFAPPEPLAIPAELQQQPQSEPSEPAPEGGLSDFLGDAQTSAETEGDGSDCKVEA